MPKVSIIIPTLNEVDNIEKVLRGIPKNVDEILVVDGHSTDGTVELVQKLGPHAGPHVPRGRLSCNGRRAILRNGGRNGRAYRGLKRIGR